ncbi:DUF6264 family protein [Curtobacterium sp. MCBD17_032]|uniref:DUF6264 family protein n=1 Tax=Curtobacterium sp. MCBD17_032 TaxID=2175659 RepID=UPI000DA9DA2D|nr:DUF6264 family protein [Curtobacterium sp. MCBD17_032]PZE81712.1 hypothetical protein DEI91_12455 [Curtobacterium sp. MCBD17_032]
MTWSNVPGSGPRQHPDPRQHSEAERVAWEQGASSLFPPAKIADRVSTVLLLAAGAVLTTIAAVAGVVAVASTTTSCGAAGDCSPGGAIAGAALAVGGAFVVGVVTLVFAIRAWIRRRTSWWIAGIGFVLTVAVVTSGTVLFVRTLDEQGVRSGRGFDTARFPVP